MDITFLKWVNHDGSLEDALAGAWGEGGAAIPVDKMLRLGDKATVEMHTDHCHRTSCLRGYLAQGQDERKKEAVTPRPIGSLLLTSSSRHVTVQCPLLIAPQHGNKAKSTAGGGGEGVLLPWTHKQHSTPKAAKPQPEDKSWPLFRYESTTRLKASSLASSCPLSSSSTALAAAVTAATAVSSVAESLSRRRPLPSRGGARESWSSPPPPPLAPSSASWRLRYLSARDGSAGGERPA